MAARFFLPFALTVGMLVPTVGSQVPPAQQSFPLNSPSPDAPLKPGTAVIRGRVFSSDDGRPLRGAQVLASSRDNRLSVTTDATGRYELNNLPAGRYGLSASNTGYIRMAFGLTRPVEFASGTPIDIRDGQVVDNANFSLPRAGVLMGRVVDELGEPVADAAVQPWRRSFLAGRHRFVPRGGFRTNDIGEFRIYGLTPGDYYLSATVRTNESLTATNTDRNGYASTYFPGTPNPAEAQRLALDVGQTISGLEINLSPIRMAKVSGTAVSASGEPLKQIAAFIEQEGAGFTKVAGSLTRQDGSFTLSQLPPGDYWLSADPFGMDDPSKSPSMRISVSGEDVTGLQLVGTSPTTVSGRIVVGLNDRQRPPTKSDVHIAFDAVHPEALPVLPLGGFKIEVHDDLSFEVKAGPGVWRIETSTEGGWTHKAVRHHGVDITDSGVEVRPGEDIDELEIELTSGLGKVSGVVTNHAGQVAGNFVVVIFSQDSSRWTIPAYQRIATPTEGGRFSTTGLRPGLYYAIAMEHVESGEAQDPELLERLRLGAVAFSVTQGEARTLNLQIDSAQ